MESSKAAGSARNKSAVLVTAQVRAKQFKPGTFHVTGELLFCSTCNVPVDFIRKDSCTKHLDSNVHKRKATNVDGDESEEAKKTEIAGQYIRSFCQADSTTATSAVRIDASS